MSGNFRKDGVAVSTHVRHSWLALFPAHVRGFRPYFRAPMMFFLVMARRNAPR